MLVSNTNQSPSYLSAQVSDCCIVPSEQFIQLYHGERKMQFDEVMMMSALY
jgi:hypothetical protein